MWAQVTFSSQEEAGTPSFSGEQFDGEIVLIACPWVSAQGLRLGQKSISWQLPRAQGSPSSFTKLTHWFVYAGVTLAVVFTVLHSVAPAAPLSPHVAECAALAVSSVLESSTGPTSDKPGFVGPVLGSGSQPHKG